MHTVAWLKKLVSFDTTSVSSNLPLIHCVQEFLQDHGISCRLTYDDSRQKANLFAVIPASDGSVSDGIILSGHTDVVPVKGQSWSSDPFVLTQVDDKLFGRGTCDMKGFIAAVLALVPEFHAAKLAKPIYVALSFDEEVGCLGAPRLIADMLNAGIKPRACIVGEPSNLQPIVAHKGIQVFRCRVQGNAAHSSLTPEGCNAIEYAAKLIQFLRALADTFKTTGPIDTHYDVPFTTLSTNLIQGGNAANTVPAYCDITFEFRQLPEVDANQVKDQIQYYIKTELLPLMKKEYAKASVILEEVAAVPPFASTLDDSMMTLLQLLTQEQALRKVAYATEAGIFQRAGIPTIVYGPGSIEQAHRPNEFVTMGQLQQCENALRQLIYLK
jgi:acetylornithine deacetylase